MTGSANVLLLPTLSESLAGRMEIITLWPFSQGEVERRRDRFVEAVFEARFSPHPGRLEPRDLRERIVRGGFPEAVARRTPERREVWFSSYITTVLQRDVRDLSNIEGLAALPRLLALLSSRIGGLLNLSEVSRSLGMPGSTLKRYFALLEMTFLVVPLPPCFTSRGKRLVKSPKVYLCDTGLAADLGGVSAERLAEDPVALGPLLENFVVIELRKQCNWSRTAGETVSLYHMRSVRGEEVDIVLENAAGEVVGVEVKAAGSVASADFKGLRALSEVAGKRFRRGIILYGGRETVSFSRDMIALPIAGLWEG